jgi:hypothetical protein
VPHFDGDFLLQPSTMTHALLIRRPWIDKILEGKKRWEIRGSRTKITGTIGLIFSGSGTIVGVCNLFNCRGPLSAREFRKNARKAGLSPSEARRRPYPKTYAWVLENAKRLKRPVPYKHPSGAIIWVRLSGKVERAIRQAN